MRKKIQLLVVLTIITLLCISLIACNNTTPTQTQSQGTSSSASDPAQSQPEENPFEEHITFSVGYMGIQDYLKDVENDELAQYVFNKLNISVEPVAMTWNDYKEKVRLWAVSGELPDVSYYGITAPEEAATYKNWVEQGIIKALPDDLSQYPTVEKIMSQADVEATRNADGHYYQFAVNAFGSIDDWASERGILVRKDWMEKLNLKDPTNFDEFVALGKAFTEMDPDDNGKNDTIGFAPNWFPYMQQLALATTLPQIANNAWLKEDGKWIPYYASARFPEYLQMLRTLYTENALDKDFAVRKDTDGMELFCQGKIGIFAYSSSPQPIGTTAIQYEKNSGLNFLDTVKILQLWKNADGETYHFTDASYWTDMIFSASVDEKKMDRMLRFLDYVNSDEGASQIKYGVPDKDYKVNDDGTIEILRAKNEDGTYPTLDTIYPSFTFLRYFPGAKVDMDYVKDAGNIAQFGEAEMDFSLAGQEYLLKNTKTIPTNFAINAISTPAKSKFAITMKDEMIKVILGKEDPAAMWAAKVEEFNAIGMQTMIDEVNAAAQELGID